MGVTEHGRHAVGLSQLVLGDVLKRALRAPRHTLWMAPAQVALERGGDVVVVEDRAEGTGDDALLAGDALVGVYVDHAVLPADRLRRAVLAALGMRALAADHRHADHRMRVQRDHAHRRLLRVAHPEVLESAHRLTEPAAGTSLRHHRQSLWHGSLLPRANVGPTHNAGPDPFPPSYVILPYRADSLAGRRWDSRVRQPGRLVPSPVPVVR